MKNESCIFTIVSKNYISHARVLINSFLKFHRDVKAFVLLADKVDGYFLHEKEPFNVIEADSLGIEDFNSFSFKYNIVEFNTAVKPFFFEYLFSKYGFRKVVYLDPDIVVFRELAEIFEALDTYSIVLTPHITSPIPDDDRVPKEIDILKAGVFNLGFLGLSGGDNTVKLLSWWKRRLYDKCLQAPLSGYAVDQIWMSLVPCLFDNYLILKNPGYNVAYWNLHERAITKRNEEYLVNGGPLYFFHFSGFSPDKRDVISKYQNRFGPIDSLSALNELCQTYNKLLNENGYHESSKWPYSYGFFKNGSVIPDFVRVIYWSLGTNSLRFGNPFDSFYKTFFKSGNLRLLFRQRFFRALANWLYMYLWKLRLKRKR